MLPTADTIFFVAHGPLMQMPAGGGVVTISDPTFDSRYGHAKERRFSSMRWGLLIDEKATAREAMSELEALGGVMEEG